MTNLNRVAMYCVDNPEHPMFRETDGARCVECNGFVNIKPVTEAQHYRLPTYQQLRDERKPKSKQSLSISLDMDTDKMQLKLRAIAKHTEALADELDAIDTDKRCNDCGSCSFTPSYTDGSIVYLACTECGNEVVSVKQSTSLEGSD